ncbi:MAG: NAD(P)H-dependent oxidoreductase [Deltaproteobacteria bacterium]|nr:NAD(P)H-dependent oxidoreductase [Deltaproteobacteria bacterium]
MRITVILAHPDPGSFNHAIARTAVEELCRARHTVSFHDLYAEGFDPLLPAGEIPAKAPLPPQIAAHCREIAAADGIVIVHPNWWGEPPAILKGWIDRVIRPGVAYNFLEGDSGEGVPAGLLRAKTAVVFNTSNTPAERERCAFGDPLELIWRNCVFSLCGVDDVRREVFGVVVTSTESQRHEWLERVRGLVARAFPAMET